MPPDRGKTTDISRCPWCGEDPLYRRYHDHEWGVPQFRERRLFEMLILEGAQAGLSWITVLRKRVRYRAVFDNFDPERIARYSTARIRRLLADPGIIRNRLKIESTVSNARAWLQLRERHGRVSDYLWQFVGGEPVINHFRHMRKVPASTPRSDSMSRELKRQGFRFVGSTICYAYMQATGMVNDHLVSCHRHRELGG